MTKRIHIQLPTNEAYAKYRIIDPVRHCQKQLVEENIHITINENIDTSADVIVLHGMLDPLYLNMVEQLATRKPIVWSVDDAMYDLPPTNPTYRHVGYTEKEVMKHCLTLADAILAPTQACANYYGHPHKTYIAPNLIDVTEYTHYKPRPTIKRYGWISGNSHWADSTLIDHLPAQYPSHEWVFFSTLPESLTQYRREAGSDHINIQPTLKNCGYVATTRSLQTYQAILNNLQLDCGLAPLHDTIFNNCKSNLKWLEYSAMGIPTVASAVVPYANSIKHGVTGYLVPNTPDAWTNAVANINPTIGRNAYFHVLENYSWQSPAREIWLNFYRSIAN